MSRANRLSGSSSRRVLAMGTPASRTTTCPPRATSPREHVASTSCPARISPPLRLDDDMQGYLAAGGKARGIEVGLLVNELLKKDIELIEAAR